MTEEEKRVLREKTKQWMYRDPEDPVQKGFHFHYCRVCFEDHECSIDDCELARETICHNCYYKLEEGKL